MPKTTLEKQREARERAERIREARRLVPSFRIPFDELPEPTYMQTADFDLENFLRRNRLTYALETYIRTQQVRSTAVN